jgi:two-component system NtrC family sensor kinase
MRFVKATFFIFLPFFAQGQVNPLFLEPNKKQADSLQVVLRQNINDTLRMAANRELSLYYLDINSDSALYFIENDLPLARKLNLKLWEADALDLIGIIASNKGNYIRGIKSFQEAIQIAESKESEKNIWQISKFTNSKDPELARLSALGTIYGDVANIYNATGNYDKQSNAINECLKIAFRIKDHTLLSQGYRSLGAKYYREKKMDSALVVLNRSLAHCDSSGFIKYRSNTFNLIGRIYLVQNSYPLALENFLKGLEAGKEQNNNPSINKSYIGLAEYFNKVGRDDSALYYGKLALATSFKTGQANDRVASYEVLANTYKSLERPDSALVYLELANTANDSLLSLEKIKQLENIGFDEQLRLQELEKEREQTKSRIRTYSLLGGLGILLVVAGVLYRNNRQKQRTNRALETTLARLKNTQAQLIQSEKMASLGELTAGIAHEIQNPLNFVNNFSEVNTELIEEIKSQKSKLKNEELDQLLDDITKNNEKISHHGKRAEAIVKGMLQHSRSSSGQKEPTDINALADEYLRLAYHGLRAKDKTFNATIKTEFQATLGTIQIVPQDIGRVVLNLITNAFYTVTEKKKKLGAGYEPAVTVSTKKEQGKIIISVEDNGNGIPQGVKDKIFQPFFTTKPTGQGTGLGLSLSYDIVKAHGGELKVTTQEGEGSQFTIYLPLNNAK